MYNEFIIRFKQQKIKILRCKHEFITSVFYLYFCCVQVR